MRLRALSTLWGFCDWRSCCSACSTLTKLWPVSAAEKLRGGLGIVADDIVAGAMAGVIVLLAVHFGLL